MLDNLELDSDCVESASNTIGGWVMELLGHVANEGETTESGVFKMTVLETDDQKILKVRVVVSDSSENDESDEQN